MINKNKLKGCIVAHGKTQAEVAESLGIVPKTFCQKLKKGVFLSNEIEEMAELLEITDPVEFMAIFFDRKEKSDAQSLHNEATKTE